MNIEISRKKSLGLLILAGGRSTRMGMDKGSLKIEGKTFKEHIASNMGSYEERFFSSNGEDGVAGFVTVPDNPDFRGAGPAAGIVSALESCKSSWLMVVPCDTPFVDEGVALALWESAKDSLVPVVAYSKNGIEPLIGIYPKEASSEMKKSLKEGNRKVIDILETIGYKAVNIQEEKLVNINRPEDYEKIREKYE